MAPSHEVCARKRRERKNNLTTSNVCEAVETDDFGSASESVLGVFCGAWRVGPYVCRQRSPANSKSPSVRTTIPEAIAKEMRLRVGDVLDWEVGPQDGRRRLSTQRHM